MTLSVGRHFLFSRYVDWSVTTPLLLLGLAMTALHGATGGPVSSQPRWGPTC